MASPRVSLLSLSLLLPPVVLSSDIYARAGIPAALPGTWTSQGCYTDNAGGVRTLSAAQTTSGTMTIETCINFCSGQNYIYAGVEYSQECFCDNSLKGTNAAAPLADCSMLCAGNPDETCGAGDRLNLFWSGATPPAGPITNPGVNGYASIGCWTDGGGGRTLPIGIGTTGQVTVASCTTACKGAGYQLAGVEYSAECYCGNAFQNNPTQTPLGDCYMTCQGNSGEFCGGPNRLNVYNYTGTDLPGGGNPGGGGEDPPPTNPGDPAPVTSGLLAPWTYANCYVDNANGRIFSTRLADDPAQTVNKCVQQCNDQGYTLAGTEYGVECYCGNQLINGATVGTGCTMGCGGNAGQACGAGNRLSVYTKTGDVTVIPVPVIKQTNLPGSWAYTGCVREPGAERVFPYMNNWVTNNTVEACLNTCAEFGYPAAGLEYGQECWCGDPENIQQNGGVIGQDSECNMPCSGDAHYLCGGVQRLTYYKWNGNLNTWNTPANKGRYEFLIGGLIVPLVATVGINNKVTFLEKAGTSILPNSTGAYELDLTLINDNTKAWREMHVKSDVFCSASLILPDKGGRQINVGGWSLDSTKGIRLYTPDGGPGVNGTNDWQEDFNVLRLQRQRWYPSAVVLTNGSIFVVGGELGSNDLPEPSVEILPQSVGGPTYLNMTWLRRTDPWNLYPYLFILPSEHVFVGYYNEALILDEGTFATITQLPNIPGNVNNFLAGRTYPLEGAAVMLPQMAPYNDPVEILICGGSTPVEGTALDNCVRIAPEAANPQWVIERMPSKRVMPCMAALPDGTFLILNGAHQGHAGFGLANDPNFNAVLYDPFKPNGQRFSILDDTDIARMYHSEATLLPDGRVLVSGSDPNPTGPQIYPEEMRLEVFLPPYLTSGARQPEFTLGPKDWTYGGSYTITNVRTYQGTVSAARVSLIAATSSTHGAIMGGRTLFPAVSCSGTTCTITAPPTIGICPPGWFMLFVLDGPTPSVGQWIRIGGDPAALGNWPNLPGFTVPGVGAV